MNSTSRTSPLPWLAALLTASAGPAIAAAADVAVAPVEETSALEGVEELDEVIVRGKRLELVIVDAEDEFYRLYNELNKDDKYDVNCAHVNTGNPGSRITSRVCMPTFVADAVVDWTLFKMTCQPPQEGFDEFDCLDQNNDHRLSQREIALRPDLSGMLADDGYIHRSQWSMFSVRPMQGPAPYQPPPPTLVLMEGTKAWYEHMLQMTRSDPRLLEMAGKLDDLHLEYMTLQRQEMERRAQNRAERARPVKNTSRGPRGR